MKKLMFLLSAVAFLTVGARAVIVSAQENTQTNEAAGFDTSTFLEDFKAEIAESNIIDNETVQELNALAQKLNEATNEVVNNAESNAVEASQ